MEKKVLFTELDDRGSHLRKQITPTAVVSDEGKYPAGMFWDANKTIKEIVAGATDAQDTLKEIEDKLNGEIGRAISAEGNLSERIDDLLGIDALDILDLKQIVEDLDPETGILSVIEQNKEDIALKANIDDISVGESPNKVLGTTILDSEREAWNAAAGDVTNLKQTVEGNELVIASALCDLDSRIKDLDIRLKALEPQPVEPSETKLVAKYNVTSTSSPTALRTNYDQNIFKSMEIDGVMLDELVTEYTFDTTGVHTVKYELYNETKLGNSAPTFYNGNLIEAVIPDSVTTIGSNAFNGCSSITSINIPSGVTSIGESAFVNCSNLTSINIPSGVTTINNSTFANCSNLTSINIPDSVTSIGRETFNGCSSITSIIVEATTPPTLGNSVFNNTDNCPIYVPSASVDAYKDASSWSSYASRIQAIGS